ncbi:MAG: hypothetical protein CR985_02020 [Flavobacteriales bacterium]|nr:MAG: hypothetical protein CR985_02020 [Flavobacteriales bacterium]
MAVSTVFFIVLAAIVSMVLALFQYYKKKNTAFILLIIRFLAVFAVLFLLVNPKLKSTTYRNVKPQLNLLIDNSTSIKHKKASKTVSNLVSQFKNNKDISEKYVISTYTFDERLHVSDSLNFDQTHTQIYDALTQLNQLSTQENTATVLITDGNQTKGADYSYFTAPHKIYSVAVGDTTVYNDLEITQLNVNKYIHLNNSFPVEVFVKYVGDKPVAGNFSVSGSKGVLFKQNLYFTTDKNSHRITFKLAADKVGLQNYTASITALPNEKNTVNNTRKFSVEVIDQQAKIALVSSVNHPDIGMIRRAVSGNKQFTVELINSLDKNILIKDYQLFIFYQPVSEMKPVITAAYKENANIFFITGTATDYAFLNSVQQDFFKAVVNASENYQAILNTGFDVFSVPDIGFKDFTPLTDQFGTIQLNTNAKTILEQTINGQPTNQPLLSIYEQGSRRGAILFGQGIFKWRMASYVQHQSFQDFDTFLNTLIQFLASSKRYVRLTVECNPLFYANENVRIKARFFDATYKIDENARLELTLVNKNDNSSSKHILSLKEGFYQLDLNNLAPGDYSFSVKNLEGNQVKYGGFTVLSHDMEEQFSVTDKNSLKKLALTSHGALFYPDQSKLLMEALLTDDTLNTVQKASVSFNEVINWKWLLALAILLFSMEWFIRKYLGKI